MNQLEHLSKRPPESSAELHEAVAAIDIGTNSVHMVVARMEGNGSLRILDTDKVTLRLGQALGPNSNISEEAIARVVETIRHMREIASGYSCRFRAVATHATRVANNHERLLNSIKDGTGIEVEVIDGVEEARLSFLGMRYGLSLHKTLTMGVDVGGGSTELIIACGEDIKFVSSLKLGAVVLTKKFFGEKGPSKSDIKDLEEYISDRLAPMEREVKKYSLEKAVIASGTAKALAMAHAVTKKQEPPKDINGYTIPAGEMTKLIERLAELKDPSKIREYTGLDQARSEIILAGALIVERISKIFGIKTWMISSFGLREGIVVDTFTRTMGMTTPDHEDIRWGAIHDYMRRLQLDETYSQHVADLALQIFDQTTERSFPKENRAARAAAREILRGAALLHEVGRFLSYSRYHRHSQYVIANSSLLGFTQNEKFLMSMVARFHRKAIPVSGADDMGQLPSKDLHKIQVLSGCLRLAAALNRTRQGRVKQIVCNVDKDTAEIVVRHDINEYPEVEMHMVQRERGAVEKTIGLKIFFRTEAR